MGSERVYTKKTLPAGKPGTKKWIKKYGENLVCVRYKYDVTQKRKIKTVEIVVEDELWERDEKRIPTNKIVALKVAYGEIGIGRLVKSAGGIWNRKKRVWELPYRQAVALGLEARIVKNV